MGDLPNPSGNRPCAPSDPDFTYRSARNPYARTLPSLRPYVYLDGEGESHRGRWRNAFGAHPRTPLHVEIGCNGGHWILGKAAQHPEILFLGLDWKFKQIQRAAEKRQELGLINVRFLRASAERLFQIFDPQEVDQLYLLFPDPWPKRAQRKNRYYNDQNLRRMHEVLAPGGRLTVRTDHPQYFAQMLEVTQRVPEPWKLLTHQVDKYAGHPDPQALVIPDVTLFERLFIRQRIAIQELELQRASAQGV